MPRPLAKSGPSGMTNMKSRTLMNCTAATSTMTKRSDGILDSVVTSLLRREYAHGFRSGGRHELSTDLRRSPIHPRAQAALEGALGADVPHPDRRRGGRGVSVERDGQD